MMVDQAVRQKYNMKNYFAAIFLVIETVPVNRLALLFFAGKLFS